MSPLEMRYRRLLALYPRDHRAVHEEEMLGVLLAAAKPEQRRPGIRDTADVVRGALLIRLRRMLPGKLGREWSDALAIVSILASILMFMGLGSLAAGYQAANVSEHGISWNNIYLALSVTVLAWPTVLLLAFVGLRRTSVMAAWVAALLGALTLATQNQEWAGLGLLAAIALTWSPGPARGAVLLGRSRMIGYLLGVASLSAVFIYGVSTDVVLHRGWAGAAAWLAFLLGVLLIAGVAFRFSTTAARLASLFLALPLPAIFVGVFQHGGFWSPQQLGDVTLGTHSLLYLIETFTQIAVPVGVLIAVVIFNRLAKRRSGSIPDAADGSRPTLPPASV